MPLTEFTRNSLSRTTARPMKRMITPIFVVVSCFCAICTYVLFDARRATLERAAEVATSLVNSIEAEISRNIETVDLSLQGVVDNLKLLEIERLDPKLRNLILFDRSTTARHLGKITVLDKAGNIRLDSKTLNPPALNLADRDYFYVHRDNAKIGMHISRPAVSRSEGYWFVALSRRLSNPDGSFAGVVAASLRLSYFEQLFKNIALGPGGNVILSRSDGVLLMRWPYKEEYIGLDVSRAKLYDELARSRSGSFEADTAIDGLHRLIVYSQIGDLPLVVGVGQATADIYAQWYEYAFAIVFVMAVLCALTIALAMYLMHEFSRRKEAEGKLAILAATDPLTNLSNRRHFNETLGREWQRGMRDKAPLSLLMLDADKFKTYNDTHGHQAGDIVLQTVGAAILAALERGGDIAARFGGDEFAILLPGTGLEGAERVAEKLRTGFAELCEQQDMTLLGLSIGIANVTPAADMRPGELVGLADLALYRAKDLGRNRTEVATKPQIEPVTTVVPDSHKAA